MQESAIILGTFPGIGNNCVGLVYDCGIPVVAAEVGMLPQLLHESAVTGLDDRLGRIRLNVQNSVIVSFILHHPGENVLIPGI
jgi:hypothetical protein